jgi:hypothetical protein
MARRRPTCRWEELLYLVFDMLNALDDSSQLFTRNPHRSAHGLLLVNTTAQKSAIHPTASRQADERGKQLVNVVVELRRVLIAAGG